jgi:hydrogenase-4 component H
MFKLLREILRTGDVTTKYPFAPFPVSRNFRGKPEYAAISCIACAACTIACPANALTMTTDVAAGTRTWMLNIGRCVFCARCEEVCPTGAIVLSDEFELAVRNKADLMVTAEFTLTNCRSCGIPFAPTKEVNYVIALLVRRGLPQEEAERRRALYETCPECRRGADVMSLCRTSLVQMAETAR